MSRTAISGDEVVEQLIATNSVDMRDADGETAPFWAVKKGKLFIRRLSARAAPIRYERLRPDTAVMDSNERPRGSGKLLLGKGVDPDHSDEFNQTPLC
jgi:hypothetical protein